jgi:outer membrane lipoprotein SlyB
MMMSRATTLLLVLGLPLVSSFAVKEGWKNRPAVPELAQSREESSAADRQPWDALRFVRQSSKFVSVPFSKKDIRTVQPGDVLWAPSFQNTFGMAPLDDVVMGGVSSSTFDNDTGLWKGKVTDANNGGFIGIRSTPSFQWNMNACSGIQLKVKSNNDKTTRFKVILRDSTDFNGVCWTTSVDVGGNNGVMKFFSKESSGIATLKIPFSEQIPTIFARTVPDQVFKPENVVGLQLTYSKFEYDGDLNPNFTLGDMDLQILEISAY